MICTENEAKQKRCPMAAPHPTVWPRCVGSDCMAWRWFGAMPDGQSGYCGSGSVPLSLAEVMLARSIAEALEATR